MKRFFLLLAFSCVVAGPLVGQTVYVPTTNEVYDFLKRMEAKQLLIGYRDAVKPIPRQEMARFLYALEPHASQMTAVEKETFEYLKIEFGEELNAIDTSGVRHDERWHLYSTDLYEGSMHIDPDIQIDATVSGGNHVRHETHGATIYGSIYKDFGFYFNFMDNSEDGNAINFTKQNTPDPGAIITQNQGNHIEYDFTNVQFTYHWKNVDFSLETFENNWSLGRRGSLTFSRKAPPAPQFKMRFPLNSWIDFTFITAQLRSVVIDSARSYWSDNSSLTNWFRTVERDKWLAAHMFELTPMKGLDISLGESIVYSDRGLQLLYIIPVYFFKSGEHYNDDKDNCQIFMNVDVNMIHGVNLYWSLFVDEFSLTRALASDKSNNQYGMTFGFQTYDVGVENVELLAEYTFINPWVYNHKYDATKFTNAGYDMGHWIGQNADDLYLDLSYRPMRALKFGVFSEVFRKGGKIDVYYQYDDRYKYGFLYPPLREERSFGFYARYQPVRDANVDLHVRTFKLEDEATPSVNHDFRPEMKLTLSYGIW